MLGSESKEYSENKIIAHSELLKRRLDLKSSNSGFDMMHAVGMPKVQSSRNER